MYVHPHLVTTMANASKSTAQILLAIVWIDFRVIRVKLKIAAAQVIIVVILVRVSKPIESRYANVRLAMRANCAKYDKISAQIIHAKVVNA